MGLPLGLDRHCESKLIPYPDPFMCSFLAGNSLRALVKYLDNIPENVIPSLNIPTGVPLVYELDADLRPIKHPDAIAPLSVSMCSLPLVCCAVIQ